MHSKHSLLMSYLRLPSGFDVVAFVAGALAVVVVVVVVVAVGIDGGWLPLAEVAPIALVGWLAGASADGGRVGLNLFIGSRVGCSSSAAATLLVSLAVTRASAGLGVTLPSGGGGCLVRSVAASVAASSAGVSVGRNPDARNSELSGSSLPMLAVAGGCGCGGGGGAAERPPGSLLSGRNVARGCAGCTAGCGQPSMDVSDDCANALNDESAMLGLVWLALLARRQNDDTYARRAPLKRPRRCAGALPRRTTLRLA